MSRTSRVTTSRRLPPCHLALRDLAADAPLALERHPGDVVGGHQQQQDHDRRPRARPRSAAAERRRGRRRRRHRSPSPARPGRRPAPRRSRPSPRSAAARGRAGSASVSSGRPAWSASPGDRVEVHEGVELALEPVEQPALALAGERLVRLLEPLLAGRRPTRTNRARNGPPFAYPYAVCQPLTSVTRNLSSRAIASCSARWWTSSKRSPSSAIPCSATTVVASGPRIVSTIAA